MLRKRKRLFAIVWSALLIAGLAGAYLSFKSQKELLKVWVAENPAGGYLLETYRKALAGAVDRKSAPTNEDLSEWNRVSGSIFANGVGVEDPGHRAEQPEFNVIAGLSETFEAKTYPASGDAEAKTWNRSHGSNASNKYSSLDQINRENVGDLTVAWTFHGGDQWLSNIETNPIIANGTIFVTTPATELAAIDAATGVEKWRASRHIVHSAARRGLLWWGGNTALAPRLFVPTTQGTYAVDPDNGHVITTFGNAGRIEGSSLVAPLVDQDRLIVARTDTAAIEAYDVATGRRLWRTPLLKAKQQDGPASSSTPSEVGLQGGSPWGGMSLDANRHRVFVSTGNPRPTLYGVTRPGPNDHTSSVVSINTVSGEIDWSFQEVHHDLWDFDIPAPPNLVTIKRGGKSIDVVAAVTKIGNTLLLERDSGKPVFDYRRRRAPVSTVPNETTAPYQPDVQLPEPFGAVPFAQSDITHLSAAQTNAVARKTRGANFGFFAPPMINGKTVTFGLNGGALWPGAAVDERSGILYVPSNRLPWLLRLYYADKTPNPVRTSDKTGDGLYQSKCANCHGANREGFYESEVTGDRAYPSLVGITATHDVASMDGLRAAHVQLDGLASVSADDLKVISAYLSAADRVSDERRSLGVTFAWSFLVDDQGYPGSKPPWGQLTAIDLNTGKKLWQRPFGEYPELTRLGIPETGQQNRGGVMATKGGLLFATGTVDGKVRAYDSATGQQLWDFQLPAPGSAPPSTFELNGEQYIVIVASGGQATCLHCDARSEAAFSKKSDAIIAFKLKK